MALPPSLVADLRNALRALGAAHGAATVPTLPGRALEAWLAMRLAQAAQAGGLWSVSLRRGDASRLPRGRAFAFPVAQSGILAPALSGPGHVLLVNRNDPGIRLELHGSLQWVGRSGATHECDVSVLPQSIAQVLRTAGGGRPRGLPVAAYECKDRPGTASPDETRQTVARLYDLALVTKPYPGWGHRMFEASGPTGWGRWRSTYRSLFRAGDFGIVRVGKFGDGARKLAKHYHIGRHEHIYSAAGVISDVEKRFLKAINRAPTM